MTTVAVVAIVFAAFFVIPIGWHRFRRWRSRREWIEVGAAAKILDVPFDELERTLAATGIKLNFKARKGERFIRRSSLDAVIGWYAARGSDPDTTFRLDISGMVNAAVAGAGLLAVEKFADKAGTTLTKTPPQRPPQPAEVATPPQITKPKSDPAKAYKIYADFIEQALAERDSGDFMEWVENFGCIAVPARSPRFSARVLERFKPKHAFVYNDEGMLDYDRHYRTPHYRYDRELEEKFKELSSRDELRLFPGAPALDLLDEFRALTRECDKRGIDDTAAISMFEKSFALSPKLAFFLVEAKFDEHRGIMAAAAAATDRLWEFDRLEDPAFRSAELQEIAEEIRNAGRPRRAWRY